MKKLFIIGMSLLFIENIFCVQEKNLAERDDVRKLSTATFFQGVAQSCAQAGSLAGARDKKEKQQATCNLIASLFQFAANVAQDSEREKQEKKENNRKKETRSELTTRTVNITLDLLTVLDDQEKDKSCYLSQINKLKTPQEKRVLITKLLDSKKDSGPFLNELFDYLAQFTSRCLVSTTSYLEQQVGEAAKRRPELLV